jgi:hypothetical protein
MTDVQTLLATEQIKVLKARYFNALDLKDWDALEDLFTEDASMDFSAPPALVVGPAPKLDDIESRPWVVHGRPQIVEVVSANLTEVHSVHQGHMPVIEITGENTATGIWQLADLLDFGAVTLHGRGHYHETYRREDGTWRIATLELRYLRHEWVAA